MKQRSSTALAVGLFLLALGGSVQSSQDKKTLETRVQELEFQVSVDAEMIQTLLLDIGALQTHRAQAENYFRAQSDEASRMAKVLDESEKEGFTSGINFHSRELLLGGWRSQLEVQGEDVPGAKLKLGTPKGEHRASR